MSFISKIGSLASRAYGWAASVAAVVTDPYYEYTTLLLPGNGTNGAQNNTFLDASTNNFTITRNGNTTQGTFSPFSQTGWGNYFNGSSYLRFTHANLSSNFTVEFWVYRTVGSTLQTFVHFNSGGVSGAIIYVDASNYLTVTDGTTGQSAFTGQTVPINTWTHIAVVRNSGTTTGYINGSSVGSNSFTPASVNAVNIAYYASGSPLYLTGYVSNTRVVNGQALYTGNFTPATAPLTTSSVGTSGANVAGSITGTVSLLTCQSNRFIDNANNAAPTTISGSPSVQAFSPFNPTSSWSATTNGGSGYFDGNSDYLSVADNTALNIGTSDFQVSFWFYPTSFTTSNCVFAKGNSNIYVGVTSSGVVEVSYYGVVAIITTGTVTAKLNAWNYCVVSRVSSVTKTFVNGVEAASASDSSNYSSSTAVQIGQDPSNTGQKITGYLADFRLVKGSGVTSVTVPTAPLTNITNTSLLLSFTNAGIYDATSKNDLETVGNAQISTTQSKWGGSSIYMAAATANTDYLVTPASRNVQLGSGDFTIEFWMRPDSVTTSWANGSLATMLDLDPSAGTGTDWWFIHQVNNTLQFGTNGAVILTSSASLVATTWQYIALVRSGSGSNNLTFYINGSSSGSATYTSTIGGNRRLFIGTQQGSTRWYKGYIQDLRITPGVARTITTPTAAFPTL